MRPGLPKIIGKVRISRHFQRPETDYHIAENNCCVDYTDTWSSKWVHWLSKGRCTNSSRTYYACENMVEFDIAVAWASLPITRIQPRVVEESNIQWLPATLHNTGWMHNRQVHHASFQAVPILDPVDVEEAYSYSASCHHRLQWNVQSCRQRDASFG